MFDQIIKILQTCDTDQGVLPPTEVYNEGAPRDIQNKQGNLLRCKNRNLCRD